MPALGAALASAPARAADCTALEAATIWRDFHDHVETQCGADGPLALVQDFAAKAAEHAARIAGVLTIVEDLQAREIRAGAMRNALAPPTGI